MGAYEVQEGHPSGRSRWLCGGLLAVSTGLVASPAAANPIGDCFERVAVAFHPHAHPAPSAHPAIHRVRHVGPRRPRVHHIAAASPTAAYAHRTRYVLRPRACETHPDVALMSPAPGAVLPQTPQALLAELAGPVAAPQSGVDVAEQAPVVAAPPAALPLETPQVGSVFPGLPPAVFGNPGPGGVFTPGGPGSGPGPVTPPVIEGPPTVTDTPPTVIDTPPTVIGQPPTVIEFPPTVPGGPPTVIDIPPTLPPGPPGAGGVPEPSTWAMLILGCFGVGGALRRRRWAQA